MSHLASELEKEQSGHGGLNLSLAGVPNRLDMSGVTDTGGDFPLSFTVVEISLGVDV